MFWGLPASESGGEKLCAIASSLHLPYERVHIRSQTRLEQHLRVELLFVRVLGRFYQPVVQVLEHAAELYDRAVVV
jgi:hypothetical protein